MTGELLGCRATADLLRRYAALPVPRYTSYPTAAEFADMTGAQEQARWLGRLDPREPVSVYLHVPYCRQLCHYCGCHAKPTGRDDVIDRYRAALEAEIGLVGRLLPAGVRIARLHWGGGTPSILGIGGLSAVLEALGRHFAFEPGFEHAIELDPRHLGAGMARGLAGLGVNRASLGVQDLDPKVQAAIGRMQAPETVAAAVGDLRAAGIDRINFDLIYGLPYQTIGSVRENCRAVAEWEPDRIACYGYAHLPRRRANQRLIDEAALPGPEQRFAQARAVAETLTAQGYEPVGIDHFAKPGDPLALAARAGRLHRNFQGYTDDDRPVLLGFGASSISRLPDGYVQNKADIPGYCAMVEEGALAAVRGIRLREADRRRAGIIERLMCDFRIDLKEAGPSGDATEDYADELALLRPLAAEGMIVLKGTEIVLTEAGLPFVRIVASVFDQFRREETKGFSAAV